MCNATNNTEELKNGERLFCELNSSTNIRFCTLSKWKERYDLKKEEVSKNEQIRSIFMSLQICSTIESTCTQNEIPKQKNRCLRMWIVFKFCTITMFQIFIDNHWYFELYCCLLLPKFSYEVIILMFEMISYKPNTLS